MWAGAAVRITSVSRHHLRTYVSHPTLTNVCVVSLRSLLYRQQCIARNCDKSRRIPADSLIQPTVQSLHPYFMRSSRERLVCAQSTFLAKSFPEGKTEMGIRSRLTRFASLSLSLSIAAVSCSNDSPPPDPSDTG